jgi:hypothetical protein
LPGTVRARAMGWMVMLPATMGSAEEKAFV